MKKAILAASAALTFSLPTHAQDEPEGAPSPNQIVDEAAAEEWIMIAPEDLLVMTLAPDAVGNEREIVIQLMSAPFSQGWVENIRTLARAEWYDGISINRVQDNYVVQWGDPGHDNPESGEVESKPLPEGLRTVPESDYATKVTWQMLDHPVQHSYYRDPKITHIAGYDKLLEPVSVFTGEGRFDGYPVMTGFSYGWPVAGNFSRIYTGREGEAWPVHCYGMVGVGRSYSPDTGSGAELYTVIGHAPRHLDRNIALVGRIISGMEHLSSLPRGSGTLGFYTDEEADMRTPILSIRVASDLPEDERPQFEYLTTEGETFARYAEARANRRDPFFIVPAGGADICNISVPIRAVENAGDQGGQ